MNAAKDSTDLVAKLRAYHHAAQNAPVGDPKKALLRYGLDLMTGDVRDNVTAGVLEPTMSKVKSLKSAYEAAVSLLRIDDAIQCVPGMYIAFSSKMLTDCVRFQNPRVIRILMVISGGNTCTVFEGETKQRKQVTYCEFRSRP